MPKFEITIVSCVPEHLSALYVQYPLDFMNILPNSIENECHSQI